jgi:hypothetical protein
MIWKYETIGENMMELHGKLFNSSYLNNQRLIWLDAFPILENEELRSLKLTVPDKTISDKHFVKEGC